MYVANLIHLFHQFLSQVLSGKSRLNSFQLGATESFCGLHQCFTEYSPILSTTIYHEPQSSCLTLRYLNIHLPYICFLENLLERTPNLEQLSIHSEHLLRDTYSIAGSIWRPKLSNTNWHDKVSHS